MSTKNTEYSSDSRRLKIRELLKTDQHVSISRLASMFTVSEMTIRRDLDKLEIAGQVRRTRGGAMPAERMDFEFDFALRRQAQNREKKAIAKKAFELIKPGQKIILDTGTTTLELAYLLRDSQDLTVITPSLAVASVLQFSSGVQTILLGGIIRTGSPDMTGPVTETNLDMFAADIAFQGTDGIGLDGTLYNGDLRLAKIDKKIRSRAEKTYILCDSTKIGKTALVTNGFICEVQALITDKRITVEHRAALEQMGANMILV